MRGCVWFKQDDAAAQAAYEARREALLADVAAAAAKTQDNEQGAAAMTCHHCPIVTSCLCCPCQLTHATEAEAEEEEETHQRTSSLGNVFVLSYVACAGSLVFNIVDAHMALPVTPFRHRYRVKAKLGDAQLQELQQGLEHEQQE